MEALNEIVAVELRWGFWKCYDRLRHLGRPWNHKRVHRVYCEMRLNQVRRTKKRVPKRERVPFLISPKPNAVWAIDYMHDALYGGRAFLRPPRWLEGRGAFWGRLRASAVYLMQ